MNDLYTEKKRTYYSNRLVWEHADGDPRQVMEPHVYEVSALSYRGLAFDGEDQSILVSGESGAGKTETVKICLNHIASVQRGKVHGGAPLYDDAIAESGFDPVVQRVVESNPLLEAFGNAKTRRNDNSSRFGKYLQLQFHNKHTNNSSNEYHSRCALVGSKCEVYLLEKNRVVGHDERERNFHIFYQLLCSSDADKTRFWSKLRGKDIGHFKYVGSNNHTTTIEGKTDAEHFQHTLQALELVGVKDEKLNHLMNAICVVLQLGNLGFGSIDADSSKVITKDELSDLADLMKVSEQDLVTSFTERTFSVKDGEEMHKVTLNAEAAQDACDALAKEIYQKSFLWLVNTINQATTAPSSIGSSFGTIGLLDIFGFEAFEINRFEQLCINYANEKLQQKFTEDIFRNVQEEYRAEGIPLADIWYDDNTDVLDLIEGNTGLLALLNEECVRPKGNDKSFVQKALQRNTASPCLIVNRTDDMSFGINHYAGKVMYDAEMFVTRNNDTLPTDLQKCAEKSSNPIVSQPRSEGGISRKNTDNFVRGRPTRAESNIAAPTVWTKYKNQLHTLMRDLRKTRSRYIRCIKPNSEKKPKLFEHQPVVEQLRCAGVVAGITISRSSFPNRLDNAVCLARYSHMWDQYAFPSGKRNNMSVEEKRAEDCKALMKCALQNREVVENGRVVAPFVVGKTRTYFRGGSLEFLESNRMRGLDAQAVTIQKAARGWLIRNSGKRSNQRKRFEEAERERLRREEEAQLARLAKESEARRAEAQAEEQALLAEIARVKKEIVQDDQQTSEALKKAQAEKDEFEKENADLVKKTDEDARRKANEPKRILAQQEKILEEQRKMIEMLKRENKKAQKEQDRWIEKVNGVDFNLSRLLESTSNFEALYGEESGEFAKINGKSESLRSTLAKEKALHEDLRTKVQKAQDDYMTQAEARLELQKTLAHILEKVQDGKIRDRQVIEQAVIIALECEADAKAEMAGLKFDSQPSLVLSDSESDLSY